MELSPRLVMEISQVILYIEDNYPELQKYLDESPLTLYDGGHHHIETKIDDIVLLDYLESLKELVGKYAEGH